MAHYMLGEIDPNKGQSTRAHEELLGPLFDSEAWLDFAPPVVKNGPAALPTPPETSSDSAEGPGLIRRVSNSIRRRLSGRASSKVDDKDFSEERRKGIRERRRLTKREEPQPSTDKALPPLPPEALSPEALSPEALSPEALSPEALYPEALSPEATPSPPAQSPIHRSPPVPPRRYSSLRSTRSSHTAGSHPLTEYNLLLLTEALDREYAMSQYNGNAGSVRRSSSLRERYPNDPTVHPLAMLRRQHRAADRAPHLHNRHRKQPSDTIDQLDLSAGLPHHHEGPFDAASIPRYRNKPNPPVEAVMDSNIEALKATPREYVLDAERKKVPLNGTAIIPPGHPDMSGNIMDYVEGHDLQRTNDASGGPLGRWDGVDYLDEDLKGKGEPSYTVEKQLKDNKTRLRRAPPSTHANGTLAYEMIGVGRSGSVKDNGTRVRTRQRSATEGSRPSAWEAPVSTSGATGAASTSVDPDDNNTKRHTGPIAAIKRRIGSIRRKKNDDYDDYY